MSNYNETQEAFDAAIKEMDTQVGNLIKEVIGKDATAISVTETNNVVTGTVMFDGEHHQIKVSFFDTYNARICVVGDKEYCAYHPQLVVALQDAYSDVEKLSDML